MRKPNRNTSLFTQTNYIKKRKQNNHFSDVGERKIIIPVWRNIDEREPFFRNLKFCCVLNPKECINRGIKGRFVSTR